MHCNFIGHLAKESDACVAVTGCPGHEMEFTINSKHTGEHNKFILHENGEVEVIESAFKVIMKQDFISKMKMLTINYVFRVKMLMNHL